MRSIDEVRQRAGVAYRRGVRSWLAGEFTPVDIPLHPPTAREAESDNGVAVRAWLKEWTGWSGPLGRTPKKLGYLGTYELPSRVVLSTPEEVARTAGQLCDWRRVSELLDRMGRVLGDGHRQNLLSEFGRWREWDDATVGRFLAVTTWLRENDAAGHYIRELPVIGVDSKWIENHRAVIRAVTGPREFKQRPRMVQLRSLDPTVTVRGVEHLVLRLEDAAKSPPPFERVLFVENYVTFLALPELASTLTVFGDGYRADSIASRLPWLAEREVVYWGDLDSHGFRILDHLRARLPAVASVLMDPDTARVHLDLAVEEPEAVNFDGASLTPLERDSLALLREHSSTGCLRVEQERIVYDHLVAQLRQL